MRRETTMKTKKRPAAKAKPAKKRSAAARPARRSPTGRFAAGDQSAAGHIARCLRQARERAELTVEQMAALTGKSKQAISKAELAATVSERTALAYAQALNLTMNELLHLDDEPNG
jgi:DNA-binding XRE family transcriptional regulator